MTASKINTAGLSVPNATHAKTADSATNATNATNAANATNATNAGHASTADNATNAGHANTADTASAASSSSTLGAGQTEVGLLYLIAPKPDSGSAFIGQEISFPHPMASTPTGQFVAPGGSPTAQCPGSYTNPQAVSGYLCVYLNTRTGTSNFFDVLTPFGAGIMSVTGATSGYDYEIGTWAATG